MKQSVNLVLLIAISGCLFLIISCSKDSKRREIGSRGAGEHGAPAGWKFTLPKGDPARGRRVFVEMECYKCHEVKGENFPAAGGERGIGPELSHMAGKHPVEFFAESIINPNAVIEPEDKEKGYVGADGKSKMPDYGDVLTIRQVTDLAAYLSSLKAEEHSEH